MKETNKKGRLRNGNKSNLGKLLTIAISRTNSSLRCKNAGDGVVAIFRTSDLRDFLLQRRCLLRDSCPVCYFLPCGQTFHGVTARSEWISAHRQRVKLMVISITRKLQRRTWADAPDFDAFDGEGGKPRGGTACSVIKLPRLEVTTDLLDRVRLIA